VQGHRARVRREGGERGRGGDDGGRKGLRVAPKMNALQVFEPDSSKPQNDEALDTDDRRDSAVAAPDHFKFRMDLRGSSRVCEIFWNGLLCGSHRG
jgi:hypothetical protein